eukprot:363200-Chlamydomonas_euryale.AAC.12
MACTHRLTTVEAPCTSQLKRLALHTVSLGGGLLPRCNKCNNTWPRAPLRLASQLLAIRERTLQVRNASRHPFYEIVNTRLAAALSSGFRTRASGLRL